MEYMLIAVACVCAILFICAGMYSLLRKCCKKQLQTGSDKRNEKKTLGMPLISSKKRVGMRKRKKMLLMRSINTMKTIGLYSITTKRFLYPIKEETEEGDVGCGGGDASGANGTHNKYYRRHKRATITLSERAYFRQ